MVEIENAFFSVQQICDSGQCFRLELLEKRTERYIEDTDCLLSGNIWKSGSVDRR